MSLFRLVVQAFKIYAVYGRPLDKYIPERLIVDDRVWC